MTDTPDGEPCHWSRLDKNLPVGLCSKCIRLLNWWDDQQEKSGQ
tara:strand:+ start:6453 stop:6584 length:132 start_codon:yes stop_codon:yes gene_type:complete